MVAKTVFIITVATYRMLFPGLPPVATAPGAEKPADPPAVRSINMELWSDQKPEPRARAEVSVPAGLKQDGSVALYIDPRWDPAASKSDAPKDSNGVITRSYWGCGETVQEGQPRVTAPDQKPAAEPGATDRFALPETSLAYWPDLSAKPLAADAAAAGAYALRSDYAGSASVTLAPEQNFLATLQLSGVRNKNDLSKPIKVSWKPVPNAVAYIAEAYGGSPKESIQWTSSADPSASAGITERPITRDEAAKLIETKVLLPANATTCIIPAGIFKGSRSVFLTVTAIGADTVQTKDGVETRVLVRSVVSAPLAGTPSYTPPPGAEEE